MAFRSSVYLKSLSNRFRGSSNFTTSTSPKFKAYAPTADEFNSQSIKSKAARSGDYVPVFVAIGMIALSVGFGVFTAVHQLARAPNVAVKKSKRETIPEVVEPEHVAEESEKFLKKSFFRKVAHVQDFDNHETMPDPIRGDGFARHARVESLKDVGVDPKMQY